MKAGRKTKPTAPKRQPLSDAAYEALKRNILTGVFSPGQYLNENEIAAKLEIGRTPVHQALQRLQLEGLVNIVPRKGIIIQHDSVGQMLEILDARILIEPNLVEKAVALANKEDVDRLDKILSRDKRNAATDFFIDKDRAFHAELTRLAANKVLSDFVGMLHERFSRYLMLQMWHSDEASAKADEDHRSILDAMRKKDAARASKSMRRHLDGIKARLRQLPK